MVTNKKLPFAERTLTAFERDTTLTDLKGFKRMLTFPLAPFSIAYVQDIAKATNIGDSMCCNIISSGVTA